MPRHGMSELSLNVPDRAQISEVLTSDKPISVAATISIRHA